jgi:hypothetical protein
MLGIAGIAAWVVLNNSPNAAQDQFEAFAKETELYLQSERGQIEANELEAAFVTPRERVELLEDSQRRLKNMERRLTMQRDYARMLRDGLTNDEIRTRRTKGRATKERTE